MKTNLFYYDKYDLKIPYYEITKKIPGLVKAGYINYDGKFISLTPEGFLVSNSVIEYLIF